MGDMGGMEGPEEALTYEVRICLPDWTSCSCMRKGQHDKKSCMCSSSAMAHTLFQPDEEGLLPRGGPARVRVCVHGRRT